ncbi:Hypothetical protein FORC64_p295 (plasmid) [Escherichia coli]|nr:Hypothetical protein FORC64_p295 [Escherichia coli]
MQMLSLCNHNCPLRAETRRVALHALKCAHPSRSQEEERFGFITASEMI